MKNDKLIPISLIIIFVVLVSAVTIGLTRISNTPVSQNGPAEASDSQLIESQSDSSDQEIVNSPSLGSSVRLMQTPLPMRKAEPTLIPSNTILPTQLSSIGSDYLYILKDVGEPYLDRFGLGPADYRKIKEAGFTAIESNFDICATPSDIVVFLDSAHDAGLGVIMTAGAGEAEWGYPCDEQFSYDQKPKWEKEKVQTWVRKWAYHPAIIAWDISNEDGQNFPNAARIGDDWAKQGFAVSVSQLQEAYRDVKEADKTRPISIRMNGWYFYDYDSDFFRTGNAFGPGVADIIMVNAYSNVDEYFPELVTTVATRTRDAVMAINPQAKLIIAIGAWAESPMWFKPSINNLESDFMQVRKVSRVSGLAVFKYGAEASTEWWMPREGADIWSALGSLIK